MIVLMFPGVDLMGKKERNRERNDKTCCVFSILFFECEQGKRERKKVVLVWLSARKKDQAELEKRGEGQKGVIWGPRDGQKKRGKVIKTGEFPC